MPTGLEPRLFDGGPAKSLIFSTNGGINASPPESTLAGSRPRGMDCLKRIDFGAAAASGRERPRTGAHDADHRFAGTVPIWHVASRPRYRLDLPWVYQPGIRLSDDHDRRGHRVHHHPPGWYADRR